MINTYLVPGDWPPDGADPPAGDDASGHRAAAIAKIDQLYPPTMETFAWCRDIVSAVQVALENDGICMTGSAIREALDVVIAQRWPDGQPPLWRVDAA